MTTPTPAEGIKPFNPLLAYKRKREDNRRIYDLLTRSLILLELQAERLHNATGEDVSETLAFVRRARGEAVQ